MRTPHQCPHFCAVLSAISLGLFFAFAPVTATHAAELKVLTARAIATVLHEIGPEFERTSGHKLTVVSGLSTQFLTMINSGEPFDVVVTASPIVDGLIKDGMVIANTRADLARSGIGVEVRAGAPKPDISSVEAFKRALLNAKSIGYLKVGSGIYLAALLDRLGIAQAIAPKVRRPDTDMVSELVAKGEIDLGMVVHHADHDHAWRQAGRAAPVRDPVVHHVYWRRERERQSAGRRQRIAQIPAGTECTARHQVAGNGACQLTYRARSPANPASVESACAGPLGIQDQADARGARADPAAGCAAFESAASAADTTTTPDIPRAAPAVTAGGLSRPDPAGVAPAP